MRISHTDDDEDGQDEGIPLAFMILRTEKSWMACCRQFLLPNAARHQAVLA